MIHAGAPTVKSMPERMWDTGTSRVCLCPTSIMLLAERQSLELLGLDVVLHQEPTVIAVGDVDLLGLNVRHCGRKPLHLLARQSDGSVAVCHDSPPSPESDDTLVALFPCPSLGVLVCEDDGCGVERVDLVVDVGPIAVWLELASLHSNLLRISS